MMVLAATETCGNIARLYKYSLTVQVCALCWTNL